GRIGGLGKRAQGRGSHQAQHEQSYASDSNHARWRRTDARRGMARTATRRGTTGASRYHLSVSETDLLYATDAYLRSFDAQVTNVADGVVELDRTAYYPTGGGQPHDLG